MRQALIMGKRNKKDKTKWKPLLLMDDEPSCILSQEEIYEIDENNEASIESRRLERIEYTRDYFTAQIATADSADQLIDNMRNTPINECNLDKNKWEKIIDWCTTYPKLAYSISQGIVANTDLMGTADLECRAEMKIANKMIPYRITETAYHPKVDIKEVCVFGKYKFIGTLEQLKKILFVVNCTDDLVPELKKIAPIPPDIVDKYNGVYLQYDTVSNNNVIHFRIEVFPDSVDRAKQFLDMVVKNNVLNGKMLINRVLPITGEGYIICNTGCKLHDLTQPLPLDVVTLPYDVIGLFIGKGGVNMKKIIQDINIPYGGIQINIVNSTPQLPVVFIVQCSLTIAQIDNFCEHINNTVNDFLTFDPLFF